MLPPEPADPHSKFHPLNIHPFKQIHIMRTYPSNSPHAAARIVALTLLADGNIKQIELTALERMDAGARLGLPPGELNMVVQDLCTDLLAAAAAEDRDACHIPPATITGLLSEVNDPVLRRTVFELCAGVARADRMMHEGELILLIEAINSWRMDQFRNGEVESPVPEVPAPAASKRVREFTVKPRAPG